MVEIHYEDVDSISDLSSINIDKWFTEVCFVLSKNLGDVNIIFCSDEYLLSMNNEHLKHDFYTDIITFDYCVDNIISGDLFISVDRVKDNASNLSIFFFCRIESSYGSWFSSFMWFR